MRADRVNHVIGRPRSQAALERRLAAALAPLRAWALGAAAGIVAAAGLGVLVLAHLTILPRHAPHVGLLSQYFPGLSISAAGLLAAVGWGFAAGFVAGWSLAVARNVAVRLWVGGVRARADLAEREFLDDL